MFGPAAGLMSKPLSRGQERERFTGDELYFTGYDLNWARGDERLPGNASYESVGYAEEYRFQDEKERENYEQQRQAAYLRQEDLLQSANEKVRRAREKGKANIVLSPEEVEALQRGQTPPRRDLTPPKTPSKSRSSRSSSATSPAGKKSSKKSSNSRLASNPSPSASRTKGTPRSSRKSSLAGEQSNAAPPAFTIAGPDGVPMYAPGYYSSSSPELVRPGSSRSRAGSRSASSGNQRDVTPPVSEPTYVAYHPGRLYGGPPGSSEDSGGGGGLRLPRNRSASNAQFSSEFFGTPPLPAVQNRRNVSGPADVSYSRVPRVQARSPLAPRQEAGSSFSAQQAWPGRGESRAGAGDAAGNSGGSSGRGSVSSGSDDGEQGVRVEVLPDRLGGGYTIDRRPVGSDGLKRRKGRK
ncbi:hypothetical protein AAFC00_003732 [Neodothiora populina]|uniref:Uncharacterized protein n=1 Tax=Neodothiora populina TaxID=2781224 RepID=A0ABR3PFN1_9PEZI